MRDTIHNSEPYYYDSAYLFPDDTKKQYPLMLMENVTLLHLLQQNQTKMAMMMSIKMSNRIKTKILKSRCLNGLCTDRCKLLTENDIKAIIEIRQYFDEPIN